MVVQPYELYCGRQCAGAAAGDARWHSLSATRHALQRGEHALLHFLGQDGGPRGGNYFPSVIRDFQLKHPLIDSKIRVWVLPVEGYEGHDEGYDGYSAAIPVDGFRGSELFRNKKQLVGLKEKWPSYALLHEIVVSILEVATPPPHIFACPVFAC